MHVAVIQQLKVESCCEVLSIVYPPEILCLSPLLCSQFVSIVGESEYHNKVAIPIEHILFKCFDISTVGFSALTTLVNECEVAK